MQAHLSLHLSKCHIVGSHMSRLILCFVFQAICLIVKDKLSKDALERAASTKGKVSYR